VKIFSNPERTNEIGVSGWQRINGKLVFNLPGELVKELLNLQNFSYSFIRDIPKEEVIKLLPHLFNLSEPPEVTGLLAWVLFPPLKFFLRQAGINENLGFFLCGRTGLMKTTISRLFLCFYGEGWSEASLTGLLTNTQNFLTTIGFFFKDLPVLFDDLFPAKRTEELKELSDAINLVYRYGGNQTYRGRIKPDGTLQTQKVFEAVPLLTGEYFPQLLLSSLVRAIFIQAFKKNLKALSLLQENPRLLNALGTLWIDFLSGKEKEIIKLAKAKKKELYEGQFFLKLSSLHPRIALNFWLLSLTLEIFSWFIEDFLKIPWRWGDVIKGGLEGIVNDLISLWGTSNPLEAFRYGLKELVDCGKARILVEGEDEETPGGAVIGFVKNGKLWLLPQVCLSLWLQNFSTATTVGITDIKLLYQLLQEEGWIKTSQTQLIRFKNLVKRALPLPLEFLELETKKEKAVEGNGKNLPF